MRRSLIPTVPRGTQHSLRRRRPPRGTCQARRVDVRVGERTGDGWVARLAGAVTDAVRVERDEAGERTGDGVSLAVGEVALGAVGRGLPGSGEGVRRDGQGGG